MHENRFRRTGDAGPVESTQSDTPQWRKDPNGYIIKTVWLGDRYTTRSQHRVVMEEMLGRPLLPGENVHHKNGVRHDNRPENLELWVTYQPSGQRVEDLLAWAAEIVQRYGDESSSPLE